MVDFGAYPAGMSTSDLIHVGELADPYDKYFEDYEPNPEQLEEFIIDRPDELVEMFYKEWKIGKQGLTILDLEEWWKQENESTIESDYESERS